jgi:hypothetical protein
VDRYYFATYDSYGARGYIIEEGDYYLIAASDAHEAVNNVLTYKGYTTADGMTANGNADMVMAIDLKTLDNANGDGVDAQSYKFSKVTGKQVTNAGTVAGKDTVEIYVQKPYTAYDKAMGVEKPAVELVGYGKTDVLAAGASETLEIKVDRYYFATYDSYGARGYIIEEGDYYLIAASDAHEAVNNVLAYKGYTTADGMTANGNADMVMAIDLKTLDKANGDGVDAQSYKFSKKQSNIFLENT